MNLRNNKGFTGVDISISLIIILIFIPTVFGGIYNIRKYNNSTKREATALKIASNILEISKSVDYEEANLDSASSELVKKIKQSYSSNNGSLTEYYYNDEDYYKINIDLSNYYPENIEEENKKDFVKKVKVIVTYMVGNNQKTVEITTALIKK